jgi:IMP dehydrogenase
MTAQEYFNEKFHSGIDGLTFDDVLIIPGKSDVIPAQTETSTMLTRNIAMNIPLLSAAMDTVTDSRLAIALAQLGGIGIVHRNFTADRQAEEVRKVKRFENIFITNPITVTADKTIREAQALMKQYSISGIPVVDPDGKLAGMITRRDLSFFDTETGRKKTVSDAMTPRKNLVVYTGEVDLQKADSLMRENRVEKLPVVDKSDSLLGLITLKDLTTIANFPNATKDQQGRLRVGAAVGTGEAEFERVKKLIEAGVDVVVVDTAHGHQARVLEMVKSVRSMYPSQNIIGGNIATAEAASDLIKAGVDAVKVGIGPGSICTTRVVAGIGVPQVSAIMEVFTAAHKHDVPIIADGGVKYSGDLAKAIVAGADCVMIGNLFAGTTESPGEFVIYKGRRYKTYRGMGSIGAMSEGSRNRYFQDEYSPDKLVPEGIEGRIAYKGDLKDVVYQLIGGLKASMGYAGAPTVAEFKSKAKFIRITNASLRESHPHDVVITKEAPNYTVDTDDF